jgi:glycosyltransferase involved in cell wall biosynthesis
MRPMRIAYVINSVEGGGAALPVPAIAEALRACGAEIKLFALTGRDRRALPAMAAAGLEPMVREGGERDHLSALAWLGRAVRQYRPDVLWTSLTRATLLGQLVGAQQRIPVVSWQHAAFLKPANRRLLRATRRLSGLWLGDSAAVSAFTAAQLGVPDGKLSTWPLFAADPAAPRAAAWQRGQAVRIGSLGRLHPVKGYDVLIAALARLGESTATFEVTIGGEGSDRARLQAAIDHARLGNVRLAGFVSDPRQWLAAQHLYVQPSRSEGFCIAAHEAMQAGLPVIASNVGEMANSILPGVTGALVPPGDPGALAAALTRVLARPAGLQALGAASRERLFEQFSRDRFQEAACAIYRRVGELSR